MKLHPFKVLLQLSIFPLLVFAELFVDSSKYMATSRPEAQAIRLLNASKNRGSVGVFSRGANSVQNDNLLQFEFSTNGPPTIRAGYSARNTKGSAPSSGFRMSFLRLVEYNDTIPFRISSSHYALSGRNQWTQIASKSSRPKSNSPIWTYTTTLKDSGSNMTLHMSIRGPVFLKRHAKTSSLKYSLTIENYPFQLEQGKLAVVKALHTTSSLLGLDSDGKLITEKFEKFGWSQSTDVNDETIASTVPISADLITESPEPTHEGERKIVKNEHISHLLFHIDAITPRKVRWTSDMLYASDAGLPKSDVTADVPPAHSSNSFLPLAMVIIIACVIF